MRRCCSRAALAMVVLGAAAAVQAQTLDDILARNLKAKGGAEKWKSVSSVRMSGTIKMQGMELPLTVYAKRPNATRQEVQMKDEKLIQAFDGTTAWIINPMTGSDTPQELPAPISRMMKNSSDFDGPLFDHKQKGNTIELVGKERLDGKDVYHLKVGIKGDPQVQHYYLDAETGVELKRSQEVDMGPGGKQTLETRMSDYRAVDGVMVPRSISQLVNGKPLVQMSIEKVEFNAGVDDALFRMPGKTVKKDPGGR